MKTIATALIALGLLTGAAQARPVDSIFTDIDRTAPRSVFADLQASAPRSIFDGILESAPRAGNDRSNQDLVGE